MARLYKSEKARGHAVCRATLGTHKNAACKGGIFVPAGRLPVDADLGRHCMQTQRPETLSVCRASSAPTENAACKGGIFVPATPEP
ncbi:hypothetical protein I5U56_18360 [Stenotrophomonas maltophilia]|nr:hypothetical protein [Stenotrophomonas maltophilia]MBH1602658.1 hypothetical protein [Stenotrophomonas maltophilia]